MIFLDEAINLKGHQKSNKKTIYIEKIKVLIEELSKIDKDDLEKILKGTNIEDVNELAKKVKNIRSAYAHINGTILGFQNTRKITKTIKEIKYLYLYELIYILITMY